jgi:hypothetical protein
MKRLTKMLWGAVLLSAFAGCGPVSSDEMTEESGEPISRQLLTPEQLEALITEASRHDDQRLHALGVCMPSNVNACVNAGYGSCASWSSWSNCGDGPGCTATSCRFCEYEPGYPKPFCYYGKKYTESMNRYRVCFNASGASCTEYDLYAYSGCDC